MQQKFRNKEKRKEQWGQKWTFFNVLQMTEESEKVREKKKNYVIQETEP